MDTNFIVVDNRCFSQKLNPLEMSVYVRICMRGHKSICFESIKNIANACSISERSVNNAFLKLKSLNMIEIQSGKNRGESNNIKLVPFENWIKVQDEVRTTCVPPTHHVRTPYAPRAYPLRTTCVLTVLGKSTQDQDSFNAAATQPAALKEKKQYLPKNKSKLWNDKTDDEKFQSLINFAIESHKGGIRQNKKIYPYPFDDFPDLLYPLVKTYGYEILKQLFDYGKKIRRGFNVRWLEAEIQEMLEIKKEIEYEKVG